MFTDSSSPISTFARIQIGIGLMLVISFLVPSAAILKATTGGMYGPVFKQFSPAVFHLVSIIIKFGTSALIAWLAIYKLRIWQRLHPDYSGEVLFSIGNFIILLYLVVRIFASTIPGGGPVYVVQIIGALPVLTAKIILAIAIIRLMIGIKPEPVNQSTGIIDLKYFTGVQVWLAFFLFTYHVIPFDLLVNFLGINMIPGLTLSNSYKFIVIYTVFKLAACYLLLHFIAKKISLWERIRPDYVWPGFFTVVNGLLLFYLVVGLLPFDIKHQVTSFTLKAGGIYQIYILKALLYVCVARLLIGIEPRPKPKKIKDPAKKHHSLQQKALVQAAKYLKNPVFLNDYMEKTGKSSNTIMDEISAGKLKAFEFKGYLYIEALE